MKMRILIVDDERIVRRGMTAIIEKANPDWKVIGQESNGAEALRFMDKEIPDVLITDIRMATMDGIRLSHATRKKYPELLIIVVSGYSEFKFAQEAVRFGALEYLLKPTAPSDLLRVLKKAEDILHARRDTQLEHFLQSQEKEKIPDMPAEMHHLIEDAVTYMTHHYNQELTTKGMADILHINPNYFCDLFKKETGKSFLDYLTNIRIEMAKKFLREKINIKSYEIAELVGYTDSGYFSRVFKRKTGMTPSEYREKVKK